MGTLFALVSFLGTYQMDTIKRITPIGRKLHSHSGYDIYHSLGRSIRAEVADKSSKETLLFLSLSKAAECEDNLAAYRVFVERHAKKRGIEVVMWKRTYRLPESAISTICYPLFSKTVTGIRWAITNWASRIPLLQDAYRAVGCLVLRERYHARDMGYSIFTVANLKDGKRFSENFISHPTPAILKSDSATLKQLIMDARSCLEKP